MGKFHDDDDENQYFSEQAQIDENLAQAAIPIQTAVVSKHAARRKKKKAQQVVCDADPSLDELN